MCVPVVDVKGRHISTHRVVSVGLREQLPDRREDLHRVDGRAPVLLCQRTAELIRFLIR